jgi:hypothetical protein
VLFENASLVPAEVVTLIEVAENGWTIVRPLRKTGGRPEAAA